MAARITWTLSRLTDSTMALVSEIKFEDGGRTEWVTLSNYAYVLPSGDHVDVVATLAWCLNCCAFVAAESISTLLAIDNQIARTSLPSCDDDVQFITNGKDELCIRMLDKLRIQRGWRELRQTAAKCLECGSERFLVVNDCLPFLCPDDGVLTTVSCVFAMLKDNRVVLLDAEGDRIRQVDGQG